MKLNRIGNPINRENRENLNENFSILESNFSAIDYLSREADRDAKDALRLAQQSETISKSLVEIIDNLVVSGDSSVEAAEARTNIETGITYTSLRQRLDTENKTLDERSLQNNKILTNYTNNTDNMLNYVQSGSNGTQKLNDLIANNAIVKIDLGKANFIIDGTVNLANKEIFNGTLTFVTNGKLVIGEKGKLTDMTLRIEGTTSVSEIILINRSNSHLEDISIQTTGASLRMTTGIRIKGEEGKVNTAHTLVNVKIKGMNKGFHVDNSESWVTDVVGVNFTITDFGDFGFAVAPDDPNTNQNSHHNFTNIVLQDTRTTTTTRTGFLIGGTWSNYTNLAVFADGDTATIIPFAMPEMINGSNLIVRTMANNFTNLVIEGNNLKCRGYEYLHNIVNLTILDSWDKRMNFLEGAPNLDTGGKVRISIKNNVLPPIADLTTFKNTLSPTIPTPSQYALYLPNASKTLVDNGSVILSVLNDEIVVKNNTSNVIDIFNIDLYVSNDFRKKLREGRFITGVFYTENDVSDTEIQDFFKIILMNSNGVVMADYIMHRYLTGEGQFSAFTTERTGSMSDLSDGTSLVFRLNLRNLQSNKTYKFKDIQLYNQAVPILNENTKKRMTTNYMSSSTL